TMALRAYLREGLNVAAIMGLGDTVAQLFIENRRLNDWDAGRSLRFSALGMVFVSPVIRRWYLFLESKVPKELPAMQRGIRKMLTDQLLFAPPFTLTMICLVPLINGESPEQIRSRIQQSYFTILGRNYMLWPLAQVINFSYIPLAYQVLYVQVIAVIWNSYLSMVLNK
ncbi:hypothetical protein KR054_001348, partial [Drosophila jambulina]